MIYIGEYVRFNDGTIGKITYYRYDKNFTNGHCIHINNEANGRLCEDGEFVCSNSINNLIKLGDILEIKDMLGNISKVEVDENFELLTGKIVAITTHEQYEANKFKIGDKE